MSSKAAIAYANLLVDSHDALLRRSFQNGAPYRKLYSYSYVINGFAISMSSEQAELLARMPEVARVERDTRVKKLTTYTPSYLELPTGAWLEWDLGRYAAGEGIVIGVVDTGIDPIHPSFASRIMSNATSKSTHFKGSCEVATEFPEGSCNGKIVGARHFAEAAIESGLFDATTDFASPLDADGHGTHTASTAGGNSDVAVEVAGMNFGVASGMAPCAQLAIYKALYAGFGGFIADVVAAIEQAVQDGVDILNLSIGPSGPPSGIATYFNTMDIALLSAVKAGVFVVQAAGNGGPTPLSILSFSPWIFSVAAAEHDRIYSNSIVLGNNLTIQGLGLAPGTEGEDMYTLVLASNAQNNESLAEEQIDSVAECQESGYFDRNLTEGNILVCMYTLNFLLGGASIKNVEATADNLSARGVVLTLSPELYGIDLGRDFIPFTIPAIIISNATDSEMFLEYCNLSSNSSDYNSSFSSSDYEYSNSSYVAAYGRILGGTNATFSQQAPRVAAYSSRGPNPLDSRYHAADVLKPNIAAPGSSIWAAWTPKGIDAEYFEGQKFAMLSGTSMATPHISGIAALVKQKYPSLSPAGIASAISTTASVLDKDGNPLLAQNPSADVGEDFGEATSFDLGSGAVNATAAMDPALIFDADFEDYAEFLCTIRGASSTVESTIGYECRSDGTRLATDLNSPFITIANLNATRSVPRTVTSVAEETEAYTVYTSAPETASISVIPSSFTLGYQQSQRLTITLEPLSASRSASFGSLVLSGSNGHTARIPIALISTTIPSSYDQALAAAP